jgi:hypothetical protein
VTRQRNDNHSTEFGLWLREQAEIDSSKGYIATNVDYVWRNHNTDRWMLIEEKRYGTQPPRWQWEIFKMLDWCCKYHPHFCGFHLIIFERTSPEDGRMWLDGREINKAELLDFLQFRTM